MKKTVLLLLSLLILLLSGCTFSGTGPAEEADYEAVPRLRVYRIASGGSAGGELLRAETVERPEREGSELEYLLEMFVSAPQEEGLFCAVPDGVVIEGSSLKDGVLTLTMSPEYLALSPMERTEAAFSAVLTFCSVDGVDAVSVRSGGQTVFAGLVPEDALLSDAVTDPYVRQLRLYFSDGAGRYLISEYHSLTLDEETSLDRYVVEELLRGPYDPELRSAMPDGTRLLSCTTDGGVCTVDLSAEFYEYRPKSAAGERLALYSLVNSLTALNGVDSVRILIEGQPVSLYRYRSLILPLDRYEGIIGPVSEPKGEFDADLFLPIPDLTAITRIPFRVRETGYNSRAEAVLSTLLNSEEPGYPSVLRGRGSVSGISVQGSVCTIDLSESFFVSLPENARSTAVLSMAASVCALPDITAVRYTLNGESAVFDGLDWSGPWTNFDRFEVE